MSGIDDLRALMARLRDPEQGCPWDCQQNFQSIVPHTVEEAYEVADAMERGDREAMCDELGDLLFQVVFYARLGEEEGSFDFEAIARGVHDKLIRRHPHVFANHKAASTKTQRATWEAIKAKERQAKAGQSSTPLSALDDVPLTLPALTRARKLQSRAARVGFDWDASAPVVAKVREELAELEQAMVAEPIDASHIAEEMGDLLFACVNLSRHLSVDPEQALRAGNRKFERRFRGLEAVLAQSGEQVESADFARLESAYQTAKASDKIDQNDPS
ncbi:MAG: nucleoside triphosphate pyrophosphohydrolase [Spiribacter sp.]|jgi:ATP diphosphatase|nr:nucleoside triphosphate pyrophosphohydrolase [Spiribacter sp.]MDR9489255.1 nucleoside triphosphate pyrophosphohydrolase [Spiribacter sp.]